MAFFSSEVWWHPSFAWMIHNYMYTARKGCADLSHWADVHADLSLRWLQRSYFVDAVVLCVKSFSKKTFHNVFSGEKKTIFSLSSFFSVSFLISPSSSLSLSTTFCLDVSNSQFQRSVIHKSWKNAAVKKIYLFKTTVYWWLKVYWWLYMDYLCKSYCKNPKISDTRKFAVITLKVVQDGFSLE